MAPQTTITNLDTFEGQGNPPADILDGSTSRETVGNFEGTGQTQTDSSNPLPKPNEKLSTETINEQEFDVQFVAEEDEKIFDEAFLNEDHLLQKYWELLKRILETPCDERAKAYENLHRRIGTFKPRLRYDHMRDDLLKWATNGFESEPKIFFMDQNGKKYHEPRTEKDPTWNNSGHSKDTKQEVHERILPADMEFFTTLYEKEVTPLIEQIFDKPKLAQREPGDKLTAINEQIRARVAKEQEKMRVGEVPLVINVDLQVPIRQLLHLMIRGTSELVRSGKDSVAEIEDPDTISAYKMLETQLERAEQPSLWFSVLGDLVQSKTKRWREHLAAQSDMTTDENLWDDDFESFVLGRAPDPEYVKRYYDGRNAPGKAVSGGTDAPQSTQESGQDFGSVNQNEVNMSDASHQENYNNPADHTGTSTDAVTSNEQQHERTGTSVFADAIKIECEPAYVLDGNRRRKIEGYLAVGRGHSLLIRMNEPEAVPAKCELTAAGPFGRSALNIYRTLSNARHIQPQADLEYLKTKSITDLHCTFIATQRGTCSRTIIGGRFEGDGSHIERQYFQSQLDRAMGKASVNGWIKQIWPEMFEVNEDDAESAVSSGDEPLASSTLGTTPTQHGAPGKRRPANSKQKKGVTMASKQSKRRNGNETYESQLEHMQTQMSILVEQMKTLQSSIKGGVQD